MTCFEVMTATLEQARRLQPEINAFALLYAEGALAAPGTLHDSMSATEQTLSHPDFPRTKDHDQPKWHGTCHSHRQSI